MTFGINGAELIILIFLAVMVLGPEKLPEYTRKLTEFIRNLRSMAEGAKSQFKEETGTDFDEIDWRRYDPRQYDPRRIIRDALIEPTDDAGPGGRGAKASGAGSTAALDAGTRGTLREDLDAVRSERDALREDLKDMDPRSLFFGSSSVRRSSAQGETDAEAGAEADGTDPDTPTPSAPQRAELPSAAPQAAEAQAEPVRSGPDRPEPALAAATGVAGAVDSGGAADPRPAPAEAPATDHRPTPFDAEST